MLRNELHRARAAGQPLIPEKRLTQPSDVSDAGEELHTLFDPERKPPSLCCVYLKKG